mmetsp:Transcript_106204/g.266016  ORF Transcript_106204/g.266016 Transcript_106204/m.266016 type:complete len:223 (+) Transcript_106204:69-737(+)
MRGRGGEITLLIICLTISVCTGPPAASSLTAKLSCCWPRTAMHNKRIAEHNARLWLRVMRALAARFEKRRARLHRGRDRARESRKVQLELLHERCWADVHSRDLSHVGIQAPQTGVHGPNKLADGARHSRRAGRRHRVLQGLGRIAQRGHDAARPSAYPRGHLALPPGGLSGHLATLDCGVSPAHGVCSVEDDLGHCLVTSEHGTCGGRVRAPMVSNHALQD